MVLNVQSIPLKGGYTVHPVPAPTSIKLDNNNKINEGGNNQKLILFKRGNAISGAPINNRYKSITKTSNYNRHYHKKNHYKSMCCYNNII